MTTLTDRYIDAVVRHLPERQRHDITLELAAAIADQHDARVDAGEPADAAEIAVLTVFGDPDRLAAQYADRPLHLIGPRYYLDWKRVLVLLLWIAPACAGVGVAIATAVDGATIGGVIGAMIPAVLGVIVHVCFWVTLVFFILERTGHETMDPAPWTPDRLPEVRGSGATRGDLVASIVWLAVLAAAIVWDLRGGLVYLQGAWMSFLNPSLWPVGAIVLFALIAAEVVVAVSVYRRGRWTLTLASLNAGLAAISAAVLLWMQATGSLVNPALFDIAAESGASGDLPVVLGVIVTVGIIGVSLWDAVDGFLKARGPRGADEPR